MTNVQQLVDQALDAARAAHPGVEFGITLSLGNALLLPMDSDKLVRPTSDGGTGYYRGHVYRDCLVHEIPTGEDAPIDVLVAITPVAGTSAAADVAQTYYGDLRTGQVTTELPADMV